MLNKIALAQAVLRAKIKHANIIASAGKATGNVIGGAANAIAHPIKSTIRLATKPVRMVGADLMQGNLGGAASKSLGIMGTVGAAAQMPSAIKAHNMGFKPDVVKSTGGV